MPWHQPVIPASPLQVDEPPTPPARWLSRAFPPGWNAATRSDAYEAFLAPFRAAWFKERDRVVGLIRHAVETRRLTMAQRDALRTEILAMSQEARTAPLSRLTSLGRRLGRLAARC